MDGLAVGIQRVPERQGHAEEALAADQPVAVEAVDPVGVAGLHVGGVPLHLVAPGHELGPQVGVAATVADVPLAAGNDLERLVALLEELDWVGDGFGLADQRAGLTEEFDHLGLSGEHGLAGQAGVGGQPGVGLDARRRFGVHPAGTVDDGPDIQVQFAPPDDVGGVAERADHGDAGALVGVGQFVGHDRHLNAEHRRGGCGVEQRLVALVVGVGHEGHAGGQQLGAGGGDVQVPTAVVVGGAGRQVEGEPVVGAGTFTVLKFGLGDRGAVGDVPQRRCFDLVCLAAGQVA